MLALNGATIDGGGNTITVANVNDDTSNYGIDATSGTISNVKIEGNSYVYSGTTYGFRAIMVSGSLTGDLYIDNVDASGATYGINIGDGNGNNLYVTDSKLGDWNSYSGVDSAVFSGCTFTSNSIYVASVRVFNSTTEMWGCEFKTCTYSGCGHTEGKYHFDNNDACSGIIYLYDCTFDGVAVTASNFDNYFVTDHNTVYVNGTLVATP